jgi:pyrimidine-nucleoside phosphorylase
MDLSPQEMKEQAAKIGLAITGQSPNLAPADGALYALRDATATTESIPLIASSILSKKIAGGCEYLALDVKAGSGAFMKNPDAAIELARWLKTIGERCGMKVHAAVTDMDQPLGSAVGNRIEVIEAIQVLTNEPSRGPSARFLNLALTLCAATLHFVGRAVSPQEGRMMAEAAIRDGRALAKMAEWFVAQGADPAVISNPRSLALAPEIRVVSAPGAGYIKEMNAGAIGRAVVELGGGRRLKADVIDPSVGITIHAAVGDKVEQGQDLLTVYAAKPQDADAAVRSLASASQVSRTPVFEKRLILETL